MRRRFFEPNPNPRRQAFEARIAQAHTLFESGQFMEAAQLFKELGNIAEGRNGPRAPRFYIQAGRCFLHARQIPEGMLLLEKGRQMFIQSGRGDVAAKISFWLKDEIKTLGLAEQAQIIAGWAGPSDNFALPPSGRPALPLKCPSCGAPIHPNEVTWLDAATAECEFCGSSLRA